MQVLETVEEVRASTAKETRSAKKARGASGQKRKPLSPKNSLSTAAPQDALPVKRAASMVEEAEGATKKMKVAPTPIARRLRSRVRNVFRR